MSLKLLILVALSLCLLGAVPPLSREQLVDRSTLIVTGTIKSVSTNIERPREGFEDRIFDIQIEVEAVEKGDGKLQGTSIHARTSQPATRPRGWAGPQGQNMTPAEGMRVRCYLRTGESDAYSLLEPNGLEKLETPATGPGSP